MLDAGKQRVNAGGVLSATEIVGRDVFISRAWQTLESQGLYLTGERRMGKTSIIRDKMRSAPPKGYQLIYLDVADVDTPFTFVDSLFRKAKEIAGTGGKLRLFGFQALRRAIPNLKIEQLGKLPENLAPTWKEMLRAVLTDFTSSETQFILAFDEMPLMLDKIKRRSGEADAMDVLDTLRKERQTNLRLRMIYTGSLGLHHILAGLQKANYQNAPLNDLKPVEVGPLLEDDATDLAWRLLNGMDVTANDRGTLARHLAQITHGMAFYIQHLVGDLAYNEGTCSLKSADQLLTERLTDPMDPWDLGYYKNRIDTHYQPEYKPVAFAFLDYLSQAQSAQTFDDLMGSVDPRKATTDEEIAQRTLELLGKDHYTTQDESGAYLFRYPLIARAWTYKRGLAGRNRR